MMLLGAVMMGGVLMMGGAGVQAAELYRWRDASGAVVYTDTLPPEKVRDGHAVLNPQGREVRALPPELSPEEREAQQRAQAQREAQQREFQAQAERDAMLLKLYASEASIRAARDARLAALDAQRQVLEHRLGDLRSRLAVLGRSADDQAELQELKRRIAEKEQALLRLEQERLRTIEDFARDAERWRKLKTTTEASVAPRARLNP